MLGTTNHAQKLRSEDGDLKRQLSTESYFSTIHRNYAANYIQNITSSFEKESTAA